MAFDLPAMASTQLESARLDYTKGLVSKSMARGPHAHALTVTSKREYGPPTIRPVDFGREKRPPNASRGLDMSMLSSHMRSLFSAFLECSMKFSAGFLAMACQRCAVVVRSTRSANCSRSYASSCHATLPWLEVLSQGIQQSCRTSAWR